MERIKVAQSVILHIKLIPNESDIYLKNETFTGPFTFTEENEGT